MCLQLYYALVKCTGFVKVPKTVGPEITITISPYHIHTYKCEMPSKCLLPSFFFPYFCGVSKESPYPHRGDGDYAFWQEYK